MFKLMFKGSATVYRMNDIVTATDVIMGVYGSDELCKRMSEIMGHMTFGDTFYTRSMMIQCVKE